MICLESDVTYDEKRSEFVFKTDDNEMFIGPDGCHYDTKSEAMYYGVFNLCGCGNPEEVHQLLLDCLDARHDEHENIIDAKKVEQLILSKPDIVAQFILHFLDERVLTEHGGSVYGSWLTPLGEQVLKIGVMNGD